MSRTPKEIVDLANALAREFYRQYGYAVPKGYRFHEATHPQEIAAWRTACLAFEMLCDTDPEDALSELEDDDDPA